MFYKSLRFRIYPTSEQIKQIEFNFGCSRFIYNYYLAKREDIYKNEKKNFGYNACTIDITQLKKRLGWLCKADRAILDAAVKDLDHAFDNFIKGRSNRPQFKYKKDLRQSYRTRGCIHIFPETKEIRTVKIGNIKAKCCFKNIDTQNIKLKNLTITREKSGKYFASIECEFPDYPYRDRFKPTNKSIGVDMGIKNIITTSDGSKISNPKFRKRLSQRLNRLLRAIKRKPSGSHNREKARLKFSKLYEHTANQRKDFLQKLSTNLIKKYDNIYIETIKIIKLMKIQPNIKDVHNDLMDVGWNLFEQMLFYKANWYKKNCIKVAKEFPSSNTCSNCGYQLDKKLSVKKRYFRCPKCQSVLDRDVNAAINILNEGVRINRERLVDMAA